MILCSSICRMHRMEEQTELHRQINIIFIVIVSLELQIEMYIQKMQEDMANLQEELKAREYTATVGGGAVTAVVDGCYQVKALTIKPEVVDPEDVEMLADLVTAAVNEAMRQVTTTSEREMGAITGGMNLPGMF